MVDHMINQSTSKDSGFYLNELDELSELLTKLDSKGEKVLLIGVTYALLDLIEYQKFKLKNTIVMETGGMKGKRKELIRSELHEVLSDGFGLDNIHSEYGMTELLSQAYSLGGGVFETPPWMKIFIRDPEDPFTHLHQAEREELTLLIWQMSIHVHLSPLKIWAVKSVSINLRSLEGSTIRISEVVTLWWFSIFFLSSSAVLN